MAAGIPDGWTTWRKTWLLSELADFGDTATQTAALLTAARREAQGEGLEVQGGIIKQQGEHISVVFNVRPRGSERSSSFRE